MLGPSRYFLGKEDGYKAGLEKAAQLAYDQWMKDRQSGTSSSARIVWEAVQKELKAHA